MERTSPGRSRFRRKLLAVGIALAVAVAAVTGAYVLLRGFGRVETNRGSPTVALLVRTKGRDPTGVENLSNVSVALFSPVPSSLENASLSTISLAGANLTDNPYEVMLAEGTSANGTLRVALGSEFSLIQTEWQSLVPRGGNVSLTMYAQYIVPNGSSLQVWSYYDNVPYDPHAQISSLNATAFFDLTQPPLVLPVGPSAQAVGVQRIGGGGGCPTQTDYTLINSTTRTGPFPIGIAYLNDGSTTDVIVLSETFATQSMQFSFDSATTNSKESYVDASGTPSYSGPGATMTVTSVGTDATNSYGDVVGLVYIPGTTLYVSNVQVTYQYASGSSCAYVNGGIQTTVEVTQISDANNDLYAEATDWTGAVGAILEYFHLENLKSGVFAAGTGFTLSDWMATDTEYNNAKDAMNQVLGIASAFDASLTIAFLVIDAADIFGPAGEAASVPVEMDALANALGLAVYIASAFDTLSFSTTYTQSMQVIGVTNVEQGPSPASLTMTAYTSTYSTYLDIGGTTYTAYMPLVLVQGTAG